MNFRLLPSLIALLLAASGAALARPAAGAGEIIAAERSFAAMAQTQGLGPAFTFWSAGDAVIFTPGPASAKATYAAPGYRFGGHLEWWPAYVGIARSGDLGFSTGPFDYERGKAHGWYFSVWRREPDGSWRWVLDHGTPTDSASGQSAQSAVATAPAGRAPPRAAGAWAQVQAAEARLAAALAADARSALPAAMWDDARIMRPGPQPAVGRSAFTAAALAGPATIAAAPIGGGVSRAGDLAWTYGKAAWRQADGPIEGHYVRVWQRRAAGWRLLVDEMTPMQPRRPAPRPAKPSGG